MLPVQHHANVDQQQHQQRHVLQASFLPPLLQNPGSSGILEEARNMNGNSNPNTNANAGINSTYNAYPSSLQYGAMPPSDITSTLHANIFALMGLSGLNHVDILSSLQQLNQNNKARAEQQVHVRPAVNNGSFLSFQQQQQQQTFAAAYRARAASSMARTQQELMARRRAIIDDVLRKAGIGTNSKTATVEQQQYTVEPAQFATPMTSSTISAVESDNLSSSSGSDSGDSACSTQQQGQGYGSITSAVKGVCGETNKKALETLGSTALERRMNKVPYFDASTLQDPDATTVAKRKSRGGVAEPFPNKLYRMLTDAPKEGHEDIISFHPHGRSFGIHQPDRFVTDVLPKYFRQSRLSSFHRQLNLYGFARINTGCDAGGYYHELFLRSRPALGAHIQRVGIPKSVPRKRGVKAYDPSVEPDFYRLPPIQTVAAAASGIRHWE